MRIIGKDYVDRIELELKYGVSGTILEKIVGCIKLFEITDYELNELNKSIPLNDIVTIYEEDDLIYATSLDHITVIVRG